LEKIKVTEVKDLIQKAKNIADPVEKEFINRIEQSILICPPQFLRTTKIANHIQTMISRKEGIKWNTD